MKNLSLLIVLMFFAINSISQKITRGPDIGEIYFMGPTATVLYDAIYHSTDFGETAVCVDSVSALSNTITSLSADKTVGGLYYTTMGGGLYYSGDYGNFNSWQLQHGGISYKISSGRNEGEIYHQISSHSTNYGVNFTSHNCQGFFGSVKDAEIDFSNNIGYCISEVYNVIDTQYLFVSFNNFNNLEVINKLNILWFDETILSRDNQEGHVYLFNKSQNELYFSSNYYENMTLKNKFSCPNLPIEWISGGRQDGEFYMLVVYLQMMGQRRHIYIYHSLDYGETFTVYHPVSIGPDPIYANFIAEDTLVEPGDTVQFTDLSNDAETWEWDFDNDGTIDSYEQNPTHVYQDTGYYTVKLSITGEVIQDYGIRYDYIHVDDLTSVSLIPIQNKELLIYPSPAKDYLKIILNNENTGNETISIFNLEGKLIKTLTYKEAKYSQNTISFSVSDFPCGIYLIRVNSPCYSQTKKIIINH